MPWKNDQVSELETTKIIEMARECLSVYGDYVEFGCYKGDTSLMLADVLRNGIKECAKKLWIYDSFEGLPEKRAEDYSEVGKDFEAGVLTVSKREVKERFLRAGLPVPVIKKGWFADLKNMDLPQRIAFAFLDGDFYESIKDSLRLVGNRMEVGGIIMIHDYNNPALPGVTKAVDEWMGDKNYKFDRFESLAVIRII